MSAAACELSLNAGTYDQWLVNAGIVVTRGIATAIACGDTALASELEPDYEYDGVQTCAVDGMCQPACPVPINTDNLVRRLRTTEHAAVEK